MIHELFLSWNVATTRTYFGIQYFNIVMVYVLIAKYFFGIFP